MGKIMLITAFTVSVLTLMGQERITNLPPGTCLDTGQCWNGKYFVPKAEFMRPTTKVAVATTATYNLIELPIANGQFNVTYGPVRVDIIETDKVCFYLTRMPGVGVASLQVMQKTNLLAGGGCQ